MTLTQFIKTHKAEIDDCIYQELNKGRRSPIGIRIDNAERRMWILNFEPLYELARRYKVKL